MKLFFLIDTTLYTNINSFIQQIVLGNTELAWKQGIHSSNVHVNYRDVCASLGLSTIRPPASLSLRGALQILRFPTSRMLRTQVSTIVGILTNATSVEMNSFDPIEFAPKSLWKAKRGIFPSQVLNFYMQQSSLSLAGWKCPERVHCYCKGLLTGEGVLQLLKEMERTGQWKQAGLETQWVVVVRMQQAW